ncbi:MAG: DHH family phosphoesterase [ANME-2 cluster archaeon]|nr:DHH family phosphoesterase [ANME-2 cluster archaeon]
MGVAVAKELEGRDVSLIFVEKVASKAETLKEQGFDVEIGDISDYETISALDVSNIDVAFILSSDSEANLKALTHLKKLNPDIYTVSRANDQNSKERLEAAGVDSAVMPVRAAARVVVQSVERANILKKAHALQNTIKEIGKGKLAIVVHNNPDPDAISGAMALKEIAKNVGVESEIIYNGFIGHQENKAFVNLLDIDIERIDEYDPSQFSNIALFECAIPGANNLLPPEVKVNIIIDHHPVSSTEITADFIDIQPDIGASATIMTTYLKELGINISSELATALLYGIRVDTHEFKKNATQADLNAAAYLYPRVDHEILSLIETPSMSTETLDIMGDAIKNRQVTGSYLISNVGSIRDRDALPQAADYLLNLEGVSTTIIFGLTEETIHLSGRSKDVRVNVGEVMREAFGEEYGGGHATSAGAQIPLGVFSGTKDKNTLMKLVEEAVVKKLFEVIGMEREEKEKEE